MWRRNQPKKKSRCSGFMYHVCFLIGILWMGTGIPLTVPAMFAYGAVAVLAVLPLLKKAQPGEDPEKGTKEPLLVSE